MNQWLCFDSNCDNAHFNFWRDYDRDRKKELKFDYISDYSSDSYFNSAKVRGKDWLTGIVLVTTHNGDYNCWHHRRPRRIVCQYINIHVDKMGWVVETPMN